MFTLKLYTVTLFSLYSIFLLACLRRTRKFSTLLDFGGLISFERPLKGTVSRDEYFFNFLMDYKVKSGLSVYVLVIFKFFLGLIAKIIKSVFLLL